MTQAIPVIAAKPAIHAFADPETLAAALAEMVANALAAQPKATLAVSGGTTPVKFFKALARIPINWSAVTITLVDDRWVPKTSPRSNAGLVNKFLLQGRAAAAKFVPLVNKADTPEAGKKTANAAIASLLPFTAAILGMGDDGHTGSFFPGGDRLAAALAPDSGQCVESMRAPAAIEPRITLTLPVLLEAGYLALHIQGQAKRDILAAALQPGPAEDMPIRAILARQPGPEIFWCP
jgi:6-phosphogluconolactonase